MIIKFATQYTWMIELELLLIHRQKGLRMIAGDDIAQFDNNATIRIWNNAEIYALLLRYVYPSRHIDTSGVIRLADNDLSVVYRQSLHVSKWVFPSCRPIMTSVACRQSLHVSKWVFPSCRPIMTSMVCRQSLHASMWVSPSMHVRGPVMEGWDWCP
jgi:hypothetical protein